MASSLGPIYLPTTVIQKSPSICVFPDSRSNNSRKRLKPAVRISHTELLRRQRAQAAMDGPGPLHRRTLLHTDGAPALALRRRQRRPLADPGVQDVLRLQRHLRHPGAREEEDALQRGQLQLNGVRDGHGQLHAPDDPVRRAADIRNRRVALLHAGRIVHGR